jgi:geranylgeranyl pyrophosphate synthase
MDICKCALLRPVMAAVASRLLYNVSRAGTLARLSAKIAALVCGASGAGVDAIGRFAEAIGVCVCVCVCV